jgi:hypothetical protein
VLVLGHERVEGAHQASGIDGCRGRGARIGLSSRARAVGAVPVGPVRSLGLGSLIGTYVQDRPDRTDRRSECLRSLPGVGYIDFGTSRDLRF